MTANRKHDFKPKPRPDRRTSATTPSNVVRLRPGADTLVTDLVGFIRSYVILSEAQVLVVALYVVHTYIVQFCYQTPYLQISSPEKQCGKSRLMEVLALLVARPWGPITTPSEAVLFRRVHSITPTLLWDEIDAVFAPKTAQYHEGHRALLDSGHRRGNKVPRFIAGKVVDFDVFCPKVFAGIGTLPDTIADRSIPIRLQRRKANEIVSEFIHQDVKPVADEIRLRLEKWADVYERDVSEERPKGMEALSDRMREGCFSLVAIADWFGFGDPARQALAELLNAERVDSTETMRVRLLRDIRQVCAERGVTVAITTEALLGDLGRLPEGSWGAQRYYGRDLDEKDLADLLSHYGVRPQNIKFQNGPKRGYRLYDYTNKAAEFIVGLSVAWERYTHDASGNE